jgi:hypothetical protein
VTVENKSKPFFSQIKGYVGTSVANCSARIADIDAAPFCNRLAPIQGSVHLCNLIRSSVVKGVGLGAKLQIIAVCLGGDLYSMISS